LEERITLRRLAEASIKLRASFRPHTMSEAAFCPTGWHHRIEFLQMIETFAFSGFIPELRQNPKFIIADDPEVV
jgi:hypothetical protein